MAAESKGDLFKTIQLLKHKYQEIGADVTVFMKTKDIFSCYAFTKVSVSVLIRCCILNFGKELLGNFKKLH